MSVLAVLSIVVVGCGCGDFKKELRRLQTERDTQAAQIADIYARLNAVEIALNSTIATMTLLAQNEEKNAVELHILQEQSVLQTQQLATLMGYTQIVKTIDPCGDGPGYDEVVVQTTAGFLVYFESGSKRFLTVLTDGSYVTTDQQNCNFKIINGEFED
jgi:hypothetical protein